VSAPTKSIVKEFFMGFRSNDMASTNRLLQLHQIAIIDDKELIANAEEEIEEISNVDQVAMQSAMDFVEDLDIKVFGTKEFCNSFVNNTDQMNSMESHLQMLDAVEASRTDCR
jgi:hypothetical protein